MFAVGDVVVCVDAKPCPIYGPTGTTKGAIYRILREGKSTDKLTGYTGQAVWLDRHNRPDGLWHNAICFRHIQRASADFTALIRQPVPVGEDA
jgi:hypothetical protein